MELSKVRGHSDLLECLKNWHLEYGEGATYDIIGLLAIIRACLENLSNYSIEGDFQDLHEVFLEEEIVVLRRILAGYEKGVSDAGLQD